MKPAFAPGDKVKVRAAEVSTHCRTPHYLRGKRGVVAPVITADLFQHWLERDR